MSVVTTQAELDAAVKRGDTYIEINSPRGVWLQVATPRSTRVEAWGSSSVEAWESSSVVAWESSSVVARGSSSVVATPHVAVHLHSARATIEGGVVIDVTRVNDSAEEWCHHHGVKVSNAGVATVYKAVNDAYMSKWGMAYKPGSKPSAPDWVDSQDCGNGLHFSPTPKQARDCHQSATRFLAVGVRVDELRPITGGGTAKCKAPRVVRACIEVDINGKPVAS